jgi:putative protease
VNKIPELLMPAGNLEKLELAYLYGADATYCGVPRYSLRARENEFTLEHLKTAIDYAHTRDKKIYFTINAFPRNSKLGSYPKYLKEMAGLKPDGFIMADPGLIYMTREIAPEIDIHISVQANTMNYAAVKFWKSIGATRVILSREVSIQEIKEIRDQVPDMELEVFVHGAVCIAHSGRCLMSNYFTHRDANQGACNNACRDQYKIFVTNPRQNNEPMEIIESEEEGTFLMNSKDMRAIQYLKEIRDAGVDSIKVEGRTKNEYYVALVARSYRKALDDLQAGKEFNPDLLVELDKVASRRYFSGFLTRGMEDQVPEDEQEFQNYEVGHSYLQSQMFAGNVKSTSDTLATFEIKNKIQVGDSVEVFQPGEFTSQSFVVDELYFRGNRKEVLSGGMGDVQIKIPFPVQNRSILSVLRQPERIKAK